MFRTICQFAQFRNCATQICNLRNYYVNHGAICKLPTRGLSDNCVREWGKIMLVVCTGMPVHPKELKRLTLLRARPDT